MTKTTSNKSRIFAYGFEKCGFSVPEKEIVSDNSAISFLDYATKTRLDEADGVIIPSGIFERFERIHDVLYPKIEVKSDQEQLAIRQAELKHALASGRWVVFLLDRVNNGDYGNWANTDLAKRLLNRFVAEVQVSRPSGEGVCKADEFREYLKQWGVAQTFFQLKRNCSHKEIACIGRHVTGVAVENSYFFLPFVEQAQDSG